MNDLAGRVSPAEPTVVDGSVDHQDGERVSTRTMWVFAVPTLGVSAPLFFLQFYYLNFATDVLALAPGVVGAILAGGRIWDAVTDPLVGYWSDRTRSRWGRRRPWMFLAAPAVALTTVGVWSPPQGLSENATVAWIAISTLCFFSALTAWSIPHASLGAELSTSSHQRSRVFGAAQMAALVGVTLAFAGMQFVANADAPRDAARQVGAAGGLLVGLLLILPPWLLRERSAKHDRGSASPLRALRDVLGNSGARRLFFVAFTSQIGSAAQGTVAPYMAIYVLKRPDLIGVLPAFFIVPLIASVPLWVALSARFGARLTWTVSMIGAAASYALLFGLRENQLVIAAALLASAGFWSGCGFLGRSLLADLVDDDARRTGERREGVYFAAWEFVEKAAGATVVAGVGFALQLSGFSPGAELAASADLALRALLGLLPAVAFIAGAWACRGLVVESSDP